MKKHWNIECVNIEGHVLNKKPLRGTKEQAYAFMDIMYDVNNVKLVEIKIIDLDELQQRKHGDEIRVHHNMCYLFAYRKGENNHNMIKDEDDGSYLSYVEKDYFKLLNL